MWEGSDHDQRCTTLWQCTLTCLYERCTILTVRVVLNPHVDTATSLTQNTGSHILVCISHVDATNLQEKVIPLNSLINQVLCFIVDVMHNST